MEYFKLRDGNKLPVIALGPGAVVRKEVLPYAHLSSNPIMGHRTKRILRIERKEYQTY